MKTKQHFTPCPRCHGQAKVPCGPSRRKLRLYREAKEAFDAADNSNATNTAPTPPQTNLDICVACNGSGLIESSEVTSINPHYPHIAIIGGGIGGVGLAVACLHRGIPFTLYERDEHFDARSQGYGLTLQQASNAMKGFGIDSFDTGITSTRHVVHNQDGKIIGEWGLRKWNKELSEKTLQTNKRKNIHIARQSLRLALLEQLGESDSIKWNHTLTDFSQNEDSSFTLSFDVSDKKKTEGQAEEKTTQADLIVGADGIRSRVREQLIGDDQTPLKYLGCIVILGICPLDALDKKTRENPLLDLKTVFQTVNGHERIYLMPYDADTIMWQLSFPPSEDEAKEFNKKGPQAMKEEGLRRLQDWHDPIPQIIQATKSSDITGYPVYDREILDPQLLENAGNVTLLGDAAHPMSPFKGQGANQALLDALNLARKISVTCNDNSWRKTGLRKILLNEFEQDMIERTTSKVQGSAEASRLLHTDAVLHEGDEPRGRQVS